MAFFELEKREGAARAGVLRLRDCRIPTPVFMPVGTLGTVKSVPQETLQLLQYPILLANAYHLYLRPGIEVLQQVGGLRHFMKWPHALLTDSGGYQVFSLASCRKIKDDGVIFRSHIDGSSHIFTPERVIDIQHAIGADIIMPLDDCPPYPAEERYVAASLVRTNKWLNRAILAHQARAHAQETLPHLFPIIQGGCYPALRQQAIAHVLGNTSADGYAIGGLSVGEPAAEMYDTTALITEQLPVQSPRYLMGVGLPENILHCVALGVDMFDCVLPTRNARNGMLFTRSGVLNIRNKRWKKDFTPIDELLATETGNPYSVYTKAYLRHLFMCNEMLGPHIASVHNLYFYRWLMQAARKHIVAQSFAAWKAEMLTQLTVRL